MAFYKHSFETGCKFYPGSTISNIIGELSEIDDISKKSSRLEFYVHLMEAEMKKIDGFKHQIPLCMKLLKDGIEMLKEERHKWNGKRVEPALLEEFMALKNNGMEGQSSQMTSMSVISKSGTKDYGHENQIPKMLNSLENSGGAFKPYKRQCGGVEVNNGKMFPFPVNHGLTLLAPPQIAAEVEKASIGDGQAKKPKLENPFAEPERKQRLCWSQQLHNRFVDVLRQLGGAKVATPKKITELMQVEGLTSEQVKSHLQKYRIHLRKLASPEPGGLSDDPSLKLSLAIGYNDDEQ